MRIKKLSKSILAMVMAAALFAESGVAYAAEEMPLFEEGEFIIEDVSEEFVEGFEDSGDTEVEPFDEIEAPSEDISEAPADEYSEEFLEEEILEENIEESDELSFDTDDVSSNDAEILDLTDVSNTGAASTGTVKKIAIFSNIEKTSTEATNYNAKYKKDGSLKNAAFSLGSEYTSMKLTAVATDKNAQQVKIDPYWKSSNEDVVFVSGKGLSATIKAVGKGKATITCSPESGSKTKTTVTIVVKQAVTGLSVTGPDEVHVGKSGKYKAQITPEDASNKKVTWSISEKTEIEGVSINANTGKLTVKNTVRGNQTITIRATAKDAGGKWSEKKVKLTKDIDIIPSSSTTIATHSIGDLKDSIELNAVVKDGGKVSWSFKNNGVAKIDTKSNKVTIKAKKSGKITATATTTDGSKKKASIVVNVITPPSSLSLTVPSTRLSDYVAKGCRLTFTPSFGDKYGKVNSTDIVWDYEVVGYLQKTKKTLSAEKQKKIKDNKYFFTLKNGTVTIADPAEYDAKVKELYDEYNCNKYAILVKASTTDGSNLSAQQLVQVVPKNTYMKVEQKEWTVPRGGTNIGSVPILSEHGCMGMYFTYSKPGIARIGVAEGSSAGLIYGLKAGTTKATIHAMDGTGLTTTITIHVYNW